MAISKENTRIIITLPKILKNELEKIAKEENRSLSNLVVKILKDYIEK